MAKKDKKIDPEVEKLARAFEARFERMEKNRSRAMEVLDIMSNGYLKKKFSSKNDKTSKDTKS